MSPSSLMVRVSLETRAGSAFLVSSTSSVNEFTMIGYLRLGGGHPPYEMGISWCTRVSDGCLGYDSDQVGLPISRGVFRRITTWSSVRSDSGSRFRRPLNMLVKNCSLKMDPFPPSPCFTIIVCTLPSKVCCRLKIREYREPSNLRVSRTVSRLSFLNRKSMKSLPKFFAAHSPSSLACSTVK